MQQVTGIQDAVVSRWAVEGWIFYLRQLPDQLGWPTPILAGIFAVMALHPARLCARHPAVSLSFAVWFGLGYLFFSAIDLKGGQAYRSSSSPVALFAVLAVAADHRAALGEPGRARPCPRHLRLFHYRRAGAGGRRLSRGRLVDRRQSRAHDHPLLRSARRSFIFNLRTLDPERRYTIIRADKLLLTIAIRRDARRD